MKNGLDEQYLDLLKDILDNGVEKNTRNGKTICVFGRHIRYKFENGKFPLLTTKKMYFKGIITELLWFLRGDTNIKYLVDNDCHIWDGDCYKFYEKNVSKRLPLDVHIFPDVQPDLILTQEEFINKIKTDDEFAKNWGELGPIYGKQWRSWPKSVAKTLYPKLQPVDQMSNLISDLKTNPDSRRMIVSAWNVVEIDSMILPPCHYGFQVYTRELSLEERTKYKMKRDGISRTFAPYTHQMLDASNIPTRAISLMFNMRSNDVPLGLPFNIASYGLLLEIIGKMVNMVPDELIASLGDAHIYKNQIDGVKEQLTREPYKLPALNISDNVNFKGTIDDFLNSCNKDSFKLDGYESHPSIKIPLSN